MTDISLRRGEALRVESGGLRMLVSPERDGWQIRVVNPWWKRWLRASRERRQARLLAQVSEHILRDVGMDLGSGDPLAVRAHLLRQKQQQCIAMAQLGLM